MLARARCPRRQSPQRTPTPSARGRSSASALAPASVPVPVKVPASTSSGWRHSKRQLRRTPLSPNAWRPARLQHRQPWLRKPVVLGVAVAALLASVAEAGAAGGSGGGRGSSSSSSGSAETVPWWYPSRDWGMLPSDNDGGGGGGGGGGGFGLRSIRFREEARLAGEFVESWLADGLAEREEEEEGGRAVAMMPVCDVLEAGNHTLRRLGASVDRCASPYFSLSEIHPSQLVYTEVDPAAEAAAKKKKEQAAAAARARRRGKERKARAGTSGGGAAQGDTDDDLLLPDEDLHEAAGQEGGQEAKEGEEDNFLGIFLFLKGDFFSVELENALTAVMPAYPRAWVVKADAPTFLSFCVQYDLHTFPQLLLFRNGHLMSRYRGRRTPEGLAAWFSLMMGNLPSAIPRRPLPPPPPPHPLSPPGLDEPLTWAALLYAVTKIVTALRWLIKRRRRMRGGSGAAAAGGRPFFRVSAAVTQLCRWLVRDLFRSRGGGV